MNAVAMSLVTGFDTVWVTTIMDLFGNKALIAGEFRSLMRWSLQFVIVPL